MQAEGDPAAERAEQWQFLMFEVDAACAVCGEPLRIGQAVGDTWGNQGAGLLAYETEQQARHE